MSKILFYNHLQNLDWNIKRIVFNNKEKINPLVRDRVFSTNLQFLPKEKMYMLYGNLFWYINKITHTDSAVDRTGYLQYYNTAYTPIPMYQENFNISYHDIVLDRANKLWQSNDTLELLFDGSLENVVACLSLIETKQKNKNLKIIYTDDRNDSSFPILSEFFIKKDVKEFYNLKTLTSNNTIITTDISNVNFSSMSYINRKKVAWDTSKIPYNYLLSIDSISKSVDLIDGLTTEEKNDYKRESINVIKTFFKNHIEQAPFQIKTIDDMLWWLGISFCNNYFNYKVPLLILYQNEVNTKETKKIDLSKWVNFYNFKEWELWNMKDYKFKKNLNSYKNESILFIQKYIRSDLRYNDVFNVRYNIKSGKSLVLDDGRVFNIDSIPIDVIESITI